jgi:hypothetical protein
MNYYAPPVRQHDTHHDLVGWPEGDRGALTTRPSLSLDAVIVPASRTPDNLEHAFGLAYKADAWLVAICSHRLTARQVGQMAAKRSFERLIAIDIPEGYSLDHLIKFSTSGWLRRELRDACTYASNLSVKRNVGLLLAQLLGWQRIFFLDDDIRNIDGYDLHGPMSMLDNGYAAAGLLIARFPDNSTVCHAHRDTGGKLQDVFVSGSSLAVDVTRTASFFPDIYNEDWLFFHGAAAAGRLGLSDCNATQLVYDPYGQPQRARWQEFGDLLAEGLYGLLHEDSRLAHPTEEYWRQFIGARRSFLEAVLRRATRDRQVSDRLVSSVEGAQKILALITPAMCVRYLRLWEQDLISWQELLGTIVETDSLGAALATLRVTGQVPFEPVRLTPFDPRAAASAASATLPLPKIIVPDDDSMAEDMPTAKRRKILARAWH